MKRLLYLLGIILAIVSCKKNLPKDYVTISGTILNSTSDTLIVRQLLGTKEKKIYVNKEGIFSDTLKNVETDKYSLSYGNGATNLYLKNGYDLQISIEAQNFDFSKGNYDITYSGKGAEPNNYFAKNNALVMKRVLDNSIYELEKEPFEQSLTVHIQKLNSLLKNTENLDSTFIALETTEIKRQENLYRKLYKKDEYTATVLAKGNVSPKFVDYENYAGGTTSLDDFKGKFVFIDVWSTRCVPCKKEIPFLKEIEVKYQDKNIEFVSISTDRPKDYKNWRAMVAEKELSGIQLYDKDDKTFGNAYKIVFIPRFILVDPDGNIVSADAPRPSDKKLTDLFDSLQI